MNDFISKVQFIPSLIGTISTIGGTAVGAPIDRMGFQGAVGILSAGAIQGSTGSTITLTVKWQESSQPATTAWTDITNEAISQGSFKFDALTFGDELAGGTTTGTWLPYETTKKYCKLADGNRQRFLRAHATLTGTVGLGPKFMAALLLERPVDTYYVSNAVSVATGNIEFNKLL